MHILIMLLSLVLATVSNICPAAEWGVLPLPKHFSQAKPEDTSEAVDTVLSLPAPISITTLGWGELEPTKDMDKSADRLGGVAYMISRGMKPYFGISVINTVRRDMPDDILTTDWKSPALLARFKTLIEKTTHYLPKDLPYFIIGNEADVYFSKHKEELEGYLAFYTAASKTVKQYYPHALTGISVTFDALRKNRKDQFTKLVQASDAAFVTFYPSIDMVPAKPADTPAMLDELIQAVSGRDVYLQEVGYFTSKDLGASQALQAEFYEAIIPAINARPKIKLASIFMLHDLEPKLCDTMTQYYGIALYGKEMENKFGNMMCSLGLKDSDGTPKQAWNTVVKALGKH